MNRTYLEIDDVRKMEKVATNSRDRLLVRLLFHLGCRVSEALAVKISDINFEQGTVTILHLKTRSRLSCPNCRERLARRHQFCPECGELVNQVNKHQQEHRRIRILPVDKDTIKILKDHISGNLSNCQDESKLLFGINRHRAWQIVRDCARKANLPNLVNPETGRVRGVSPHRLSDAFSVHAMKLDDSADAIRLLQEHLGHASFNTTAKYRKVAGEEHREWYEHLFK